MKKWLNKNLIQPILEQLKQGYTINKISLSIATGISIACIPVLGTATAICIAVAYIFRLNHIVIQTVNYLAYPLQLALLIPFLTYGQTVFGKTYRSLDLKQMFIEFAEKPIWFFETYGLIAIKGTLLWMLFLPLAIPVIFFAVRPFIRGLKIGVEGAKKP